MPGRDRVALRLCGGSRRTGGSAPGAPPGPGFRGARGPATRRPGGIRRRECRRLRPCMPECRGSPSWPARRWPGSEHAGWCPCGPAWDPAAPLSQRIRGASRLARRGDGVPTVPVAPACPVPVEAPPASCRGASALPAAAHGALFGADCASHRGRTLALHGSALGKGWQDSGSPHPEGARARPSGLSAETVRPGGQPRRAARCGRRGNSGAGPAAARAAGSRAPCAAGASCATRPGGPHPGSGAHIRPPRGPGSERAVPALGPRSREPRFPSRLHPRKEPLHRPVQAKQRGAGHRRRYPLPLGIPCQDCGQRTEGVKPGNCASRHARGVDALRERGVGDHGGETVRQAMARREAPCRLPGGLHSHAKLLPNPLAKACPRARPVACSKCGLRDGPRADMSKVYSMSYWFCKFLVQQNHERRSHPVATMLTMAVARSGNGEAVARSGTGEAAARSGTGDRARTCLRPGVFSRKRLPNQSGGRFPGTCRCLPAVVPGSGSVGLARRLLKTRNIPVAIRAGPVARYNLSQRPERDLVGPSAGGMRARDGTRRRWFQDPVPLLRADIAARAELCTCLGRIRSDRAGTNGLRVRT